MVKNFAEQFHDRKPMFGILISLFLTAIITYFFIHRHHSSKPKKPHVAAVPIAIAKAEKGDIGVYLSALGTVVPVYTVTVLSRVQGEVTMVRYTEGETVRKGDPLLEIDSRPYDAALKQAEGTLARDKGVLREAEIDLERYRKAYARRAIPKQQLDDQVQVVVQAKGTVLADEGTLEGAQANVSYCHISSPINGRIGLRLLDPGNMVQANSATPLVVITQVRPITVIFNVSEDYLPLIQNHLHGQNPMSVEIYDRAQVKKLATGALLALDNQIDLSTGTLKIRSIFENEDLSLFPNQFVNAKLLVETQQNVTLIPSSAIQRNAQGAYVYLIQPNETAAARPVKPGPSDEGKTAVTGIHPGDVVAMSGFDRLQEGSKVQIRSLTRQGQLAGQQGKE